MPWRGGARCVWRGVGSMPEPMTLIRAARRLVPPGTMVAGSDPTRSFPLFAGEDVAGMVPRRQAEFSAGRHAARMALGLLGLPPVAIPQGKDRAPVWPVGLAATITHSASACLAAASRDLRGLGLDLEPAEPLEQALWDSILHPDEQARAAATPDPGLAALLVFSAKEAAYKAQYPLSRQLFDFDTLGVTFGSGTFTARFLRPIGPFAAGFAIEGRWTFAAGHALTAAWL